MKTSRAVPHFRVAEYEGGQPWIVMEPYSGDGLLVFRESVTIGFNLTPGTPPKEAESIAEFMREHLIAVAETAP